MSDPDIRTLRRIPPVASWNLSTPPAGAEIRRALVLDTETTGLDPATAKIIECAIVPFDYCAADDSIVAVHPPQSWLQDPGEPLTEEVKRVTHLTDEILAGQKLDHDAINALVGDNLSLTIAHNANYDRQLCERHFPWARGAAWACSMEEIDWHAIGAPSRALEVLAWSQGWFYDAHRGVDDCLALVFLLTRPAPDGRPLSAHLIASARRPIYRVFAVGSPFEAKDRLKTRGYRWNPGRKVWYRDVGSPEAVTAEEQWLGDNAGSRRPEVDKLNAYHRYRGELPDG